MLSPGVAKILPRCLPESSLLCEGHVVFGQNRHKDNNLPGEVPTWFLNLSNVGALGPVAFIVTQDRFCCCS